MAFDLANLNSLESLGDAPLPVKATLIGVLCALILVLGYFLDIKGKQEELSVAQQTEAHLKQTFEEKQNKAVNLEAYKQQMKEMEESFGTMLRQLPSKTEVADLLVDITQTGLASGLTFTLFKPETEIPREFYAELPITIEVTGTYHQFGAFVSGIAALPRIVTVHEISIAAADKSAKTSDGTLKMKTIAKTYRYMDPEEIAAQAAAAKKKQKKGR